MGYGRSVHAGVRSSTMSSEDVCGEHGGWDSRLTPCSSDRVPVMSSGRGSGVPEGMQGSGKLQSYFKAAAGLCPLSESQPPLWSAAFSPSSETTGLVTPHRGFYGQLSLGCSQTAPIITPPLFKGEREPRSSHPSIMGRNGLHGHNGGRSGRGDAAVSTPVPPSPGNIGGFVTRSSAEEEAFKAGYATAFAQFERQKKRKRDLDIEHERERQMIRVKQTKTKRNRLRELSDLVRTSPLQREGRGLTSMIEERRLSPTLVGWEHTLNG